MPRDVYVRGRLVPVRTHPMAPAGVDADVLAREIAEDDARCEQLGLLLHAARTRALAPVPWLSPDDGLLRYLHESWGGCWRVVRWKGGEQPCTGR